MSGLFYDEQKRQPKPWVIVAIILVPILMVIIGFIVGTSVSQNKKATPQTQEEDIFEKF